jgi:hypothetical protein
VTWQPAWHLARRHRSWRRARKYTPDAFLSARFVCCSVFAPSPPPSLGKRPPPRRRRLLSGHPHAQLRRRGRPTLWSLRPASSAELARPARLPRLGRPPPCSPATAQPARRAPAPAAPSPATAQPARRAPAPATPSPAVARSLPAHCRPR